MPGGLQVNRDQPEGSGCRREMAHLLPLPFHAQVRHPFPLLDVAHFQRAQLLAANGMVAQRRQDCPVELAFQRVGSRGLEKYPGLVVPERWRDAFTVHRARPFHAQPRVLQDRVTLAQIGIGRGQRSQLAADGIVREVLTDALVAPGNHMRASHFPERFRPIQSGQGHEVLDVLLVSPVGALVR